MRCVSTNPGTSHAARETLETRVAFSGRDPSESLSTAFPTVYAKRFIYIVKDSSAGLAMDGKFRSASRVWVMFGIRPCQTAADPKFSVLGRLHFNHNYWQSYGEEFRVSNSDIIC